MTEAEKDTLRSLAAAKKIIDGRNLGTDYATIMVTLEHMVSVLLLILMNDPRKAAAMLNETLVPGIEYRLALAASRRAQAEARGAE